MKRIVGEDFALGKKSIHRRPKAGESRYTEKQRIATEISLRPSMVGVFQPEGDDIPCNRLECLRKDGESYSILHR